MLKISDKFAKETEQRDRPERNKSRDFLVEHWLGFAIVLFVFGRGLYVLFQILG